MARQLDIVLFGATGITGRHVISVLSKWSKKCSLSWGIAGRSRDKLKNVLQQYLNESDTCLDNIPIILANVEDEESLKLMTRKTRLIINCCGPYRLFGEPVIRACVEEGTDHIDMSGEPHFMELMQLKYDKLARERGIYIVSACGFDSIPTDLGVVFLQQNFDGVVNSVASYLHFWVEGPPIPGPTVTYGTWKSAVDGLANADDLKEVRKKLFPERLPKQYPKLKLKTWPHKSHVMEGWACPFPGADRSVINRTQRYFYEKKSKRPIQVETYYVVKSFIQTMHLQFLAILNSMLVGSSCGRRVLLKHPEVFSDGIVGKKDPAEKKAENLCFNITLYGEGWKDDPKDLTKSSPPIQKSVVAKVQGRNPAYGTTGITLVLAAILILTEREKLPAEGGVYTPGAAFEKTSMIAKLNKNGLTFDIVPHL